MAQNLMDKISHTYQQNRLYFNVAGLSVFTLLVFFDILQSLIMNFVVMTYLGYQTMELLVADEPAADDTENRNLRYTAIGTLLKKWATYSVFIGMETIVEWVMFWPLSWVYPFGKLVLYLWVINDSSNASAIYDDYIHPMYIRNRPLITKLMSVVEVVAQKIGLRVDELLTDLLEILKEYRVLGNLVNAISFGSLSQLLDAAHNALDSPTEETASSAEEKKSQ